MKIDSSDVLVALCVASATVLAAIGVIESDNAMMVLTGVLGYAAREVVKNG